MVNDPTAPAAAVPAPADAPAEAVAEPISAPEPVRPAAPSLPPPAEGILEDDGADAVDAPPAPVQPPPLAWVQLDALADEAAFALRSTGEVDRLATDIARVGQLEPVDLRPAGEGRYQVITGFRRVAALRLLQRDKVLARVHGDLPDEDALLLALAPAIHQRAVSVAELQSARDRLASGGHLTGLLRDMLEKALAPDDLLESEFVGGATAEEEIDADELALTTAARLAELNQDLALLADVYAGLDDDRKLELLRQLRYSADLVAFLEKVGT
jgi:ParB family chromosome partitioning protein